MEDKLYVIIQRVELGRLSPRDAVIEICHLLNNEPLSKERVEDVLFDWYNYLMDENNGKLSEEMLYVYLEEYYND